LFTGARFQRKGVTPQALAAAKAGTVRNSRLECPHCRQSTAMAAIRGDRRGGDYGLRQWENADLVPGPDDTFQERLYCIRWRLPDLASLLWAEQQGRAGGPCTRPVPEWVPLAACRTLLEGPEIEQFLAISGGARQNSAPSAGVRGVDFA
jgi:hypothetical protein